MRAFLGWFTLVTLLGGLAFVVAPPLARPIVAAGVRAALPFPSDRVDVDVSVEALGLLRGSIDRVHISGTDLAVGSSTIGVLEATVRDVAIEDHSFTAIEGALGTVVVALANGTRIPVDEITLAGRSSEIEADARIGRTATIELARAALSAARLPIDGIELVDGGLQLSLLGRQTDVTIGAADGALVIAGSVAGESIVLFGPGDGDAWRITGASAGPDGLDVQAVFDLDAALSAG